MDIQATEREEDKLQQDMGEAMEAVEMTDTPLGTEILDNPNTRSREDIPTCDIHKAEMGSTTTPQARVYPNEHCTDDEEQTEGVHTPPIKSTALRSKKHKVERDDPASRERKRSKSRHKTIYQ